MDEADGADNGSIEGMSVDDDGTDRAPICPHCGVTALPADPAYVLETAFVCENPDCDEYGEQI